ncbi:MAG: cytochrome C biogenesis protein [Candidatus Diapherotrites archaeon]|nr:cytochrome C biogenesis protein [Candidatus Diapherotrites archaeon]
MAEPGFLIAFLAGLASFLSPCVFPLIPAYLTFLGGTSLDEVKAHAPGVRKKIFLNSILFVLGFAVVFSLLGVLLQSVLLNVAYDVRTYLGYVGGIVIIFFGLVLLGIIKIDALQAPHTLKLKKAKSGNAQYGFSFLFGAAFAVGWTPCVGPILGTILTLAATKPETAFPLMLTYSVGLGIPFLLAGFFFSRATRFIERISPWLKWFNLIFGVLLIILGILVFTNQLGVIANLWVPQDMLVGG